MTVNLQKHHDATASATQALLAAGSSRLKTLCDAVGLADQSPQALSLFQRLVGAWGNPTPRASGSGDLPPFEFTVTCGPSPELCLVVDIKPGAASLRALLAELAASHAVDLKRFHAVEDLYFPESLRPGVTARVWVSFAAQRAPRFELCLDPTGSGAALAPLCVERTLVRLGFSRAWPVIGQRLTRRGPDFDALKYVVLDLSSPSARVEVYARHQNASDADLEQAAAASSSYRSGDVGGLLKLTAVAGESNGVTALSCYEFTDSNGGRPSLTAIVIPVQSNAQTDPAIQDGVITCLEKFGLSTDPYARARLAMADEPLAQNRGSQSHVTFRRNRNGEPSVTVRFALRAGASDAGATSTESEPLSGVMEVVNRYEHWDQITNHPFLHRLRSEPVNLHHIWNILANFQASISKTFSQRLALIASRVDDPETRFIVTKLLYDEMGSGDYALAHVNLFSAMMKVIEPWKPSVVDDWTLGAGARFNESMDQTYGNADINIALGAIVSGEIFGKQFDQFLGDEIRRQNQVDPSLFVWVTLHESLEVTHAGEGADIAHLVPAEGVQAMSQGAYGLSLGAWTFLTDVYEICYCERPSR